MTVSVSLAVLQDSRHAFGVVRAFGTLGFFCMVIGFPWLLDILPAGTEPPPILSSIPSEPQLGILFPLAAGLTACATLAAFFLPTRGTVALRALQGEWRQLLTNGPFLRLTLVGFLAFLCLHGPMDVFPIYIRDRGGSIETIRNMWFVMLIPEMLLMTLLGAGLRRLGARGLLALGIGAGGLRWILCSFVTALPVLYPIQVLHAVTVTGLFLGGPLYIEATTPAQLRSTGQALFGMIGMGLGGFSSSLLTGWLLERAGTTAPYLAGGIGALTLVLFLPRLLPPPNQSAQAT
jgi:PPP family 3-phenylpropionic acid transporter